MNQSTRIHVGHPAYSGSNRLKIHATTHGAVIDLIKRGVPATVARAKVNEAVGPHYPHITCTCDKTTRDVVEIVVRSHPDY